MAKVKPAPTIEPSTRNGIKLSRVVSMFEGYNA
eukprot:CAMPEP_0182925240 /NCGR_PEP_ID=MMETSP0105_2-20130417/8751_1 /TAXON_ID=81532 ORGANISM="Acanthoeca-like sp., Strain 10tr" /NCGR_SAMPLE_ID=MMETSP0105_2 /ASSEMBLY_ACC=CAM_ASM_000205 /LENGTH=32 /DNA_ID= /DNA_START= /DNA_END= /DNA_ORIENTATION=